MCQKVKTNKQNKTKQKNCYEGKLFHRKRLGDRIIDTRENGKQPSTHVYGTRY